MAACKYVALYGEEAIPGLCARACDGDYCIEHLRLLNVIDALDREMQQIVREAQHRTNDL